MFCQIMGFLAFGLFFLGDYNDWKLSRRSLRFCFPCGTVLLFIGTFAGARWNIPQAGISNWLPAAFSVLFFFLLIYTLFFALPVGASYTMPGKKRSACTSGMYALCRHPGVLWFSGLYFCLSGCTGFSLYAAVTFSLLNILLVLFEDKYVFPAKLDGYDVYKTTTPFLLPSRKSISACILKH